RKSLNPGMGGRDSARVRGAVAAYLEVAQRHGLDPIHMALAWCRTRPFMMSAIFGATTFEQLEHALGAVDVTLADEVLAEIDAAHRAYPMPY
ncbi:aldo/keto reductase, partial [Cribrihabitans sp. XS_ASV171]